VNDEQIIEYLRSRSRAVPPPELPQALMVAVEGAPAPRSWFTALVPAAAAVGAAGMLLVVALLIGQPPGLTTAPSGSEEPTPLPSLAPTALPTPAPSQLSLTQPGAVLEIPAVDDSGEWGTIRIERRQDLGGYPDVAMDPELFVIEFFVSYAPERMPDPAQFGASDWALRAADPNAEHFFLVEPSVFERTDGAGSRPDSPLGIYPGAIDIFTTPAEGTIAFDVTRREANLAMELVYLRTGQAFAARDPGDPPEPVAVPTSAAEAAEAAAAAAAAEVLFMTADECTNPSDGYTVSFPDDWYTNTETGDVPACSWFTPQFFEVSAPGVAPEQIWISIGVVDGVVAYTSLTEIFSNEEITVDGRDGRRVEFNPEPNTRPDYRAYHYVVPLGENGPTLVASTNSDAAGDYALAKAVLDRIMASFEFEE
jgi:hypothetical protein